MAEIEKLYNAILDGDHKAATALTRAALDGGADAAGLISRYMIPAMAEAGRRFECEDYFVPELMLSARAMKAAMELARAGLATAR